MAFAWRSRTRERGVVMLKPVTEGPGNLQYVIYFRVMDNYGGLPADVASGAHRVYASVDVDDLARGPGKPVGEQRDAGTGRWLRVGQVPADRGPGRPDALEIREPGDRLGR